MSGGGIGIAAMAVSGRWLNSVPLPIQSESGA